MQEAIAHIAASPATAFAVILVAMAASVVQFGLGMGFGLTAAPLLALIDPVLVPVSTLYLGLATTSWGAWAERDKVVWHEVWTGSIGRIFGASLAAFVLTQIPDRQWFSLVFGLLVGLAVLLSVSGWRMPFSRTNLIAMSGISGLMATITSVGAPPLAIIYQDRPAAVARPTLAAFFAVGCTMSLAILHLTGWATWRDFALVLVMVPGVLAGYAIARRIGGRFDKRYRPLLLTVSGLAAAILIVRGLTG